MSTTRATGRGPSGRAPEVVGFTGSSPARHAPEAETADVSCFEVRNANACKSAIITMHGGR